MLSTDLTDIDRASPALTGTPSTIAPVGSIARTTPNGMTWQQMLSAIVGLGGNGQQQAPLGGLMQGAGSNVNSQIPLYTPPLQAIPDGEEQKKQTTEGDVQQYAKIIAALFGGGAGIAASPASTGFSGGFAL